MTSYQTITVPAGTYALPVGQTSLTFVTNPYYTTGGTTASTPSTLTLTGNSFVSSTGGGTGSTPFTNSGFANMLPSPMPPDAWNKYVNGSDLLEEFIAYAGANGARADDIMSLPVELFVKWLVIRACETDEEEAPVALEPRELRRPQPRCLGCQRFMQRDVVVPLHGSECARLHFARQAIAA